MERGSPQVRSSRRGSDEIDRPKSVRRGNFDSNRSFNVPPSVSGETGWLKGRGDLNLSPLTARWKESKALVMLTEISNSATPVERSSAAAVTASNCACQRPNNITVIRLFHAPFVLYVLASFDVAFLQEQVQLGIKHAVTLLLSHMLRVPQRPLPTSLLHEAPIAGSLVQNDMLGIL